MLCVPGWRLRAPKFHPPIKYRWIVVLVIFDIGATLAVTWAAHEMYTRPTPTWLLAVYTFGCFTYGAISQRRVDAQRARVQRWAERLSQNTAVSKYLSRRG